MDWKIPFSGRQHAYTIDEMMTVLHAMEDADPLTQGRYRDEFEAAFAEYLGVSGGCFAVSNATAALELAAQMLAADRECHLGDRRVDILVPAHTFTSTVYPFVRNGFRPVWVDIDQETHVVNADCFDRCWTDDVYAIVVPHLYGYMADMREIWECLPRGGWVPIVEDAAQVLGTEQDEVKSGVSGDFGVFSLHSHKNVSTLGEGGVLYRRHHGVGVDEEVRMLRHNGHCSYGEREDYWVPAMGNVDMPTHGMPHNFCLGEVECALGTKLLERIDKINVEKRRRALWFIDELSDYGQLRFHRVDSQRHNYHLLVARFDGSVEGRDEFIRQMAYRHGVQCVVQYRPLYRYPFYQKLGLGEADCPVTDDWYDHMVSFPFHHSLTERELEYEVECVKKVLDA